MSALLSCPSLTANGTSYKLDFTLWFTRIIHNLTMLTSKLNLPLPGGWSKDGTDSKEPDPPATFFDNQLR